MKLKDWLALDGNSATKLAEETGVSVSTITRAAEGKTIPSRELMPKIVAATGGSVRADDFFDIGGLSTAGEAEAA